jgi:hypothetical protein
MGEGGDPSPRARCAGARRAGPLRSNELLTSSSGKIEPEVGVLGAMADASKPGVRRSARVESGKATESRWRPRSAIFCTVLAVWGCSGTDEGKRDGVPRTPVVLAPDTTSVNITWKPETVVVGAEAIAASLRNRYAEDGVYRFDSAATEIAALSPGQVVVLTGVDLVRVTAVETTEDAIVVSTEPASLTDAVSDAEISWGVGVDVSEPIQLNDGSGMLRPLAAPEVRCTPPLTTEGCESSFEGTLGNLKTKQKMTTAKDGTLKMSLSMEYPQVGNTVLKVALDADVRSFVHEGSFVIHGGSLESAYVTLRDIEVAVDIDAGAVAIGVSDDLFKLPLKLTFPFELGPIPAYVTISGAITLNPALSDESGFRTHAKFHVTGSSGFTMDKTTIRSSGSLENVGGVEPTASNVSYVSTVNAGFGVLYEFPRVGLGIGLVDKASLEGYVTPKFEVVMNEALKLDGLGLISSSCATVKGNVGVFAGGVFRLGGVKLSKEEQLYGGVHEIYRAGRAHGQADPSACD